MSIHLKISKEVSRVNCSNPKMFRYIVAWNEDQLQADADNHHQGKVFGLYRCGIKNNGESELVKVGEYQSFGSAQNAVDNDCGHILKGTDWSDEQNC